jgi:hypothetical protein
MYILCKKKTTDKKGGLSKQGHVYLKGDHVLKIALDVVIYECCPVRNFTCVYEILGF